jgi:hypothetical protein
MSEIFNRNMLTGRWYRGSGGSGEDCFNEYAEMRDDGSFEFIFIELDEQGKELEKIIELGDWGLVGDIHFTITKGEVVDNRHYAADLVNEDNYHAYKILQLNSQNFEYQHVVTNEVFILRRVIDNIGHC